jgi:hypothetical protein
MSKKIGVNESCPCGSGKKYKKCCRLHTFIEVGPATYEQKYWQEMTRHIFTDIKEPHCRICGDTKKLMKLQTQNGESVFCDFCFSVQMSM